MSDRTISAGELTGNKTDSGNDNSIWMFKSSLDTISDLPVDINKIITSIYFTIGVLANLTLLVYLIKYKRYRSSTFMLITSLACCDCGSCFGGLMLTSLTMPYLLGPTWLCKFCLFLASGFYCSSILHVIIFSILRFIQLVYPLRAHSQITPTLVFKFCLTCWVISVLGGYGTTTYYIPIKYVYGRHTLVSCVTDEKYASLVLSLELLVLGCSNVVIAGFHIAKHILVKRHLKKDISSSEKQAHQRQATDGRAITLVIALFGLTSQPQVWHTLSHFVFNVPLGKHHLLTYSITLNVAFANAAIDPFIYVLCAKSVRKDIVKMLWQKS